LTGTISCVCSPAKGESARHEIFYFDEADLGAVRIDDYKYVFLDQPDGVDSGWLGPVREEALVSLADQEVLGGTREFYATCQTHVLLEDAFLI
jgi:hypothetical protein